MTEAAPANSLAAPAAAGDTAPAPGDRTPAAELDCRGLSCPLPILKTRKALTALAPGAVLRVIATDPGSVPDMAAFSRRTGHRIVDQSESGGEYVFLLRRA